MLFRSTLDLSGAEIETRKRIYFERINENIRGSYDYIIIDSPPSLGLLTINSFTAADEIIIHCKRNFFDARFG
jgi:chromosome partitioning protein